MKRIFSYFTKDDLSSIQRLSWFTRSFPESEFKDLDKLLYFYLAYCTRLAVPAVRKYLEFFLESECRKYIKKYNIRVESIATYNYEEIAAFEQAVQILKEGALTLYDKYLQEENPEEDFKVHVVSWMNSNIEVRIQDVLTSQFVELQTTKDSINMLDNTEAQLHQIKEIYDERKLDKLDFEMGVVQDGGLDLDQTRRIFTTGSPCIDGTYGGVYSKALLTFAGQPGGGKTRFMCASFVYPALVKAKVGVRVDELELTEAEVKNMLLSIHIANLYKVKIPDSDINRGDLTEEQKRIVESARIDLFESGKYGRLALNVEGLIYETMEESMLSYFKLNPDIQLWCIDYIGLIQSKPRNAKYKLSVAETISESLKAIKRIIKTADRAAVGVNQFNDEGNKKAEKGVPIGIGDIQGGQAVQRNSDYDLALTFTPEQRAAGISMLSTTKVRACAPFTNIPLQVDMSISRFKQLDQIGG